MELMQLRYFVVVAQYQSMTRAAEALYMTQPALSRSIARLERELDLTLFRRTANRVQLTEAGARYLQAVRQALDALDAGLTGARRADPEEGTRIRVVSAIGLMKQVAAAYEKEHHLTRVSVELADTQTIVRSLLEGKADLGVSLQPVREERLHQEVLLRAGYYLVASAGQELYNRPSVSLTELQGRTLFCSRFGDTRSILERHFAESAAPCNVIELDEQDLLFQASMKGLGYTLCIPMPSLFRGSPAEGQVRFIPVEELRQDGRVLLMGRKTPAPDPRNQAFIRAVRSSFAGNEAAIQNL